MLAAGLLSTLAALIMSSGMAYAQEKNCPVGDALNADGVCSSVAYRAWYAALYSAQGYNVPSED
jgi:hypothetical protein